MKQLRTLRSFDALRDADLQQVYDQTKQEALREYAFRVKLDSADSLKKPKELVFDDTARMDRWTARELLEISNRFRLLDAPEYESRLYEKWWNHVGGIMYGQVSTVDIILNKLRLNPAVIAQCQ